MAMSHKNLARLENQIAAATSIIRDAQQLALHANDEILLLIIADIQRAAQYLRKSTIDEMNELRGNG